MSSIDHRLAQSVDMHAWLQEDIALSPAERLARDRGIASALGVSDEDGANRVLAWWQAVQTNPDRDGLLPRMPLPTARR